MLAFLKKAERIPCLGPSSRLAASLFAGHAQIWTSRLPRQQPVIFNYLYQNFLLLILFYTLMLLTIVLSPMDSGIQPLVQREL